MAGLDVKFICGIDPGLTGAIAFIKNEGVGPDDLHVFPMPVLKINSKNTLDDYEFARMVDEYAKETEHAFLEKVGAMPKQGVTSSFNFGTSYGIARGLIAANFIPRTLVAPVLWKKGLRVQADKDAARARASELMPAHSRKWKMKKQDGLAEAALIALYGARVLGRNMNPSLEDLLG